MARIEKTVFISYRRKDLPWALLVYQNLTAHNFDVFFDYTSLSGGDFEQIIIGNIKARAHFLVILTPSALDRCNEPGDWLRREIETAVSEKRNIIPLLFNGFSFGAPSVSEKLTGKLAVIKKYNGLEVPGAYFYEAMERLRNRYLNVVLDTVLHPISEGVQKVVEEQKIAADEAIAHKKEEEQKARDLSEKAQKAELLDDLVKARKLYYEARKAFPLYPGIDGKISELDAKLSKIRDKRAREASEEQARKTAERKARRDKKEQEIKELFNKLYKGLIFPLRNLDLRLLWLAIVVSIIGMIILFGRGIIDGYGQFSSGNKPITRVSNKDSMTMVYVRAGNFPMGSNDGQIDEKPVHNVYLDNFWIDQTEVTNAMYAQCVQAQVCAPPRSTSSFGQVYYGNEELDDYPVIQVSWDDANTYCNWVGRRLPSEAEWEKAASWDEKNQMKYIYPWGNTFKGTKLNFCDKSCTFGWASKTVNDRFTNTAPVGRYPSGASPYGVYDMAGNVWEWVADWYSNSYYSDSPSANPLGPDTGDYRVLRGGAWLNLESFVRTSDRNWSDPALYNYDFGFRCAVGTQ